jgi:hypothetical protein
MGLLMAGKMPTKQQSLTPSTSHGQVRTKRATQKQRNPGRPAVPRLHLKTAQMLQQYGCLQGLGECNPYALCPGLTHCAATIVTAPHVI